MVLAVTGLALAPVLVGGAAAQAASRALPAGCVQPGGTVICSYNYTGLEQVLPIPAGVTSVQITAIGAAGGTTSFGGLNGSGGEAAQVTGTVAVRPGSDLYVEVGGTASTNIDCAGGVPCAGGFNGGGDGGVTGAGGGGASDVRTISRAQTDFTLGSRLMVAGGGGGSGQGGLCLVNVHEPGGAGGAAGLTGNAGNGGAGTPCSDMTGALFTGATGGIQSAGGTGGHMTVSGGDNRTGQSGTYGAGGATLFNTSGGGGGGYWGGGSGADIASNGAETEFTSAGGGGGGSSEVPAGGTAALTAAAAGVTISYTPVAVHLSYVAVRISGPREEVAGSRFIETIVVTNYGPAAALGVTTTADLPRQLTVITAGPAARGGRSARSGLSWSDPVLAAGAKVAYSITFRAGPATGRRARLLASVTTSTIDLDTRKNRATASIAIRNA